MTKATILYDYNASISSPADDCFQFIDCSDVNGMQLAKDVRAGVIQLKWKNIVIALGNNAGLDQYTNVTTTVNMLINAIIERKGCVNVQIWILSLIPRIGIDDQQVGVLQMQNRNLFKAVRALVRRKNYPVKYITAHKWFLKREQHEDGTLHVVPDLIYYYRDFQLNLNEQGLAHLHLLIAKQLKLCRIDYSWEGMPLVKVKHTRQISKSSSHKRHPLVTIKMPNQQING